MLNYQRVSPHRGDCAIKGWSQGGFSWLHGATSEVIHNWIFPVIFQPPFAVDFPAAAMWLIFQRLFSMDWFKGKFTGLSPIFISWENTYGFRCRFSQENQSIDIPESYLLPFFTSRGFDNFTVIFQVFFSAAPCLTEPSSWEPPPSRPWSAITFEWLKPQSLNIK